MTLSRNLRLAGAWMGASVVFLVVALGLFIPVLMGECLPRDLPETAVCDAAKQRDVTIYVAVLVATPVAAAMVARIRSARQGIATLLAGSILPMLLVVAANALIGN